MQSAEDARKIAETLVQRGIAAGATAAVPSARSLRVKPPLSCVITLGRPKSATFTRPRLSIITLEGLMSR